MATIFGLSTDQPYTAKQVRDALVQCFVMAHEATTKEQMKEITQGMAAMSADRLTRLNIEQIVFNAFRTTGGSFDAPTKESIVKAMGALKEFSKQFRAPEVIEKNYGEMMKLVEGLRE